MLKKLKIKQRLIAAFLIVALLSSVSGIVSSVFIKKMDQNYSMALTEYGFAQGDIGKAMLMLSSNRRLVRDIVNFKNLENIDECKAQFAENKEKYDKYAAEVEKSLVNEESRKIYEEIQKDLAEYEVLEEEIISLGESATEEECVGLRQRIIHELDPVYMKVYNHYLEIMELKVNFGDQLSDQLSETGKTTYVTIILLLIVTFVLSGFLGVAIAKGVTKPIAKCVKRIQQLAEGDFKTPVPEIHTEDETKLLANATQNIVEGVVGITEDMENALAEVADGNFDVDSKDPEMYVGDYKPLYTSLMKIVEKLSYTMTHIHQAADQVSVGSEQVSDSAQTLAQGATEQASSIEELSATIAEISDEIKQNAGNAEHAKEGTEKVGDEITESDSQMQEMIAAMNDINEKSNEIGKIIKTVDDIAFQTNILALNAAVEAARAGEAGKGFAVVADEVRNLAGKSAEAAKNTASLIEETVDAVEKGALMADNTAKAMAALVEGVKDITVMIEEIAGASHDQANAVAQVRIAVEQISSVVQNNSATAEESAAASEELNGQAQIMKDLVKKFKIKMTQNEESGHQEPAYASEAPVKEISDTYGAGFGAGSNLKY